MLCGASYNFIVLKLILYYLIKEYMYKEQNNIPIQDMYFL